MESFKLYYKKQYDKAINAIENHRITEALVILSNLESLGIKSSKILNLKGFCFYLKCDFFKARESFNNSFILENSVETKKYLESLESEEFKLLEEFYNKALIEIEGKNYRKAKEYLEILKEKEPTLINSYKWLFLIYNELGNKKLALENIDKSLELDKTDFEIINWYNVEHKKISKFYGVYKKLLFLNLIFFIFFILFILFN